MEKKLKIRKICDVGFPKTNGMYYVFTNYNEKKAALRKARFDLYLGFFCEPYTCSEIKDVMGWVKESDLTINIADLIK